MQLYPVTGICSWFIGEAQRIGIIHRKKALVLFQITLSISTPKTHSLEFPFLFFNDILGRSSHRWSLLFMKD